MWRRSWPQSLPRPYNPIREEIMTSLRRNLTLVVVAATVTALAAGCSAPESKDRPSEPVSSKAGTNVFEESAADSRRADVDAGAASDSERDRASDADATPEERFDRAALAIDQVRPDTLDDGTETTSPIANAARADHFITYTDGPIDFLMAKLRRAGFVVSPPELTVRHAPGLRNGFVYIGPEYLEYCWVEREEEFEARAAEDAYYRTLRESKRPYGIGLQVADPETFRTALLDEGFVMPEVIFAKPQDAAENAPAAWGYGMFPEGATPGAHSFYLSYLSDDDSRNRNWFVGENAIFQIAGVVLVTEEPRARARAWAKLLRPSGARGAIPERVVHGPHAYVWVTPEEWESMTATEYPRPKADFHELTAVVALTFDLERTVRYFDSAELPYQRGEVGLPGFGRHEAVVLYPDPRTGFSMVIYEADVEAWLDWREQKTGTSHRIAHEVPVR